MAMTTKEWAQVIGITVLTLTVVFLLLNGVYYLVFDFAHVIGGH